LRLRQEPVYALDVFAGFSDPPPSRGEVAKRLLRGWIACSLRLLLAFGGVLKAFGDIGR
jgi:hypothetical protein